MTKRMPDSYSAHDDVTFMFNGAQLTARRGISLAAALIDNEHRATRTSRINQKPRGVFCGIGVCFDCLVIVDGVNNQRSCLIEVAQGMNVETQNGTGDQQ